MMTPMMTSSAQLTRELPESELTWIVEMPKEIADIFGVPEGLPVRFRAEPGSVSAHMDLTQQVAEARWKEPGWFLDLPSDAAAVSGFPEGAFIGVYAKSGTAYVEIILPTPRLEASVDRLYGKYIKAWLRQRVTPAG